MRRPTLHCWRPAAPTDLPLGFAELRDDLLEVLELGRLDDDGLVAHPRRELRRGMIPKNRGADYCSKGATDARNKGARSPHPRCGAKFRFRSRQRTRNLQRMHAQHTTQRATCDAQTQRGAATM